MLKFHIIFTSVFFLLLAGMNSNARASVANDEGVKNSTDKPDKESEEHSSNEIITDLDFFGAFSLVNVQLQWRDLFVDLNKENCDSESDFDPNEIFIDKSEFLSSLFSEISSPICQIEAYSTSVFGAISEKQIENKTAAFSRTSEQETRTIAYIQNCGTYPNS